ncbi:MAG: DUF4870 domain-containing protein [Pyrinomonadaceae bacterium]|nr:DUF4870 domain-containing protein [Pyrinomonadaceae bacterium]
MQNMQGKTALGLDANVGALICYLGNLVCALGLIYSIVVIVTDKTNKLTRFHAFQSVLLTVAGIVIGIPLYIIMFVGIFIDAQIGAPLLTMIMGLVLMVFGLAMFVLTVLAAIKGFQGQIYKVPIIGNLADKYSN